MAEIAAGALVAEQVVSTTIEGGVVAGYALSKPTMPLKATLRQIGKAPSDDATLALARSNHTLTILGGKAHIFGGESADGKLTPTDVYSITLPGSDTGSEPEYACYPAVPLEEGRGLPSQRTRHAACPRGKHVVVFGGSDEIGNPIEEESCIWLWDSERLTWAQIESPISQPEEPSNESGRPCARFDHKIFADFEQDILIVHGGKSSSSSEPSEALKDTWVFEIESRAWYKLPDAPAAATDAAFEDGNLYTITGLTELSSEMHVLRIGNTTEERRSAKLNWQTFTFPTNGLVPGPRPREGSALLPVSTGYGRQYLLYLFGFRQENATSDENMQKLPFFSDIWTYQLPAKSPKPTSWTDFKPAVVKDVLREKLGFDSGGHSWGEVEVQASEQGAHEGKVHPGPRAFFGADVLEDGKSVVLWGGLNPRGERESDGWIVHLR